MRTFINVEDIGPLEKAMAEAMEIKNDRYKYQHLGKNKTLMMIFFNNSLRTRLSTQKAAMNLGMNVIVLDVNAGAWKLETERGVIMDGDKSEHLLEAYPRDGVLLRPDRRTQLCRTDRPRVRLRRDRTAAVHQIQRAPCVRDGNGNGTSPSGICRPDYHPRIVDGKGKSKSE